MATCPVKHDHEPIDFTAAMHAGRGAEVYRTLRMRGGGPYRDPGTGFHVITDYQTVRKIASDNQRFSNKTGVIRQRKNALSAIVEPMYAEQAWPPLHTLVTNDPPSHRRFRSLVERLFTAQRVREMEPGIANLVNSLIDKVIDRGTMDGYADYANLFPCIIAGEFLGLPSSDHAKLKYLTDGVLRLNEPILDPEVELDAVRVDIELLNYILERANISAAAEDGSFMHHVRTLEVEGERLTDQELVWFVKSLFVGGHDSVTFAAGTALLRIIETPGLEEELRQHPDRIPNFIEEVLRFDAPVQCLWRRAIEDIEIQGTAIKAGEILQLQWAAANRDDKRFPEPDSFQPGRDNAGQHVSFGAGPHACIGSQLARAELRIALDILLRRTRNWRLADGDAVAMRYHYLQWGVVKLNFCFDRLAA